jgi:predicted metal-dependent hydrolase
MHENIKYTYGDIEFSVVYTRRRTLGISVHTDSSVIVRVPYRTSMKTIERLIHDKYGWVVKHRDNYRKASHSSLKRLYADGEKHLFRGKETNLHIENSAKQYVRFEEENIMIGCNADNDPELIKKILYAGYKNEAIRLFPEMLKKVIEEHRDQDFKPAGLVIRTMKRRWGSCSNKGIITLSTELIKLPDIYIEYVMLHELCHLKHHNHGIHFYNQLSEVFPHWKNVRKELRRYTQ